MFSVPFNVSAKNGKIFATHTDPALLPAPDVELLFRGANWAGMQSHGCQPSHLAQLRAVPQPAWWLTSK
jgi:hypothetical protein